MHDYNAALDVNGKNASIIKLTSKIGNNYISMDPIGSISNKIESILAVTNREPDSMTGSISNGGILPANGIAKFTINYSYMLSTRTRYKTDQYGSVPI